MKQILTLTFCLGLALAQTAHSEEPEKGKARKPNAAHPAVVEQHNGRVQSNAVSRSRQLGARNQINAQREVRAQRNYNRAAAVNTQRNYNRAAQINARRNYNRNYNRAAQANTQRNYNRNYNRAAVVNAQRQHHDFRNIAHRNGYAEARRFHWHGRHDRGWWRSHYSRFALFGGGYYFWNNGYWYPAYGYDPVYTTYAYDEPIYGYSDLAPGQVIVNVQTELQRQGYYEGEIDGLLGPMTRRALAAYQNENGLIVTRSIDQPTLEALGLV